MFRAYLKSLFGVHAPRRQTNRPLRFESCEQRLLLCVPALPQEPPGSVSSPDSCSDAFSIQLEGVLPQRLEITDSSTGERVFNADVTQREFDTSFLHPGDYVIQQTSVGGTTRSRSLLVDLTGAETRTNKISFEGATPRRVRIVDELNGQPVWDNWIYGSTLDVVGMLQTGNYRIQHASSGQNWQTGSLSIGASIPSYRIYAEVQPDQTLLVDWGNLGSHPTAHIRVAQQDNVIVDADENGSQLRVTVPPGVITIETAVSGQPAKVQTVGTPVPSTSKITLPGPAPLQVQIIDTTNDQTVFVQELLKTEVDLAFLPVGNYLLRYASAGGYVRTLAVAKDTSSVHRSSSALTLEGALPRRVWIREEQSERLVWDNWIYGSDLDVVGMLPVGDYTIQHAASGERTQSSKLRIGADVPSYRVYAEVQSDQTLLVDWGNLGSHATVHVRITQQNTVIIDKQESASQLRLTVPRGVITIEIAVPGQPVEVITVGTPVPNSSNMTLPGALPRQVLITDTSSGVLVYTGQATQRVFDLEFLPPGDYLVQHAGPSESYRSMSVSVGASSVLQGETILNIEGRLPRRLRILDASTNREVFDNWIYGAKVNVVDLLPKGEYIVNHAASGENWRVGELSVGAFIPSYRLYFERLEGNSVRVDWGFVGEHENVRLRGLLGDDVFQDSVETGGVATVSAPAGAIDFQVILAPVVPPSPVVRTITLPGNLPRHVRVFNSATGRTVLEVDQTTRELEVTSLTPGHYILEHAQLGEAPKRLVLAISSSTIETFDPAVEFTGKLPRRLIFTDIPTGQVVWDYWIYGSTVDVLGLVPPGTYAVRHAASGESWRKGELIVGASVPSYRLYTEQVSSQAIKINWGPFGSESSARIQVLEDSIPILDITQEEAQATLNVPQGDLTVRVTVAPNYAQSLQHCSLPALAQDGTCRSFSKSLYFNLVSNAMLGFTVPGSFASSFASPAEVILVERPRHGTLQSGDGVQFQTYKPASGFVGQDSAVFRVVEAGGTQRSVLVTFKVAAPANPQFAHFVPGIGTTQPDYRTPGPSQLIGPSLPYAMIVNSDFGSVIERINVDGTSDWRLVQESPTGAVDVIGQEAVVARAQEIRFINVNTGVLNRTIQVALNPTDVLQFANPLDSQRLLVSWYTTTDVSYVGIWNIENGWEWSSQRTYRWPRWADVSGDVVVVADTYGHRIIGESITTGLEVFEIPAFFPNDARFLDQQRVLITEEHSDRVWIYNWVTGDKELVISAPGPRSDLQLPFDVVVSLSNSPQLRVDPSSRLSLSKSSTEFSGINTVYAPNGAVQLPDGTYYVADTDNHRVIHVAADGNVLAEMVGFNNPTKVAYVLSAP